MVGTSKAYKIISYVVMVLWAAIIILPFLLLLMSSLTDEQVLVANGYSFFPKKFSAASYSYIFQSGDTIMQAYGISILVTLIGTLVSVILTALMAFPLSINNLPGRRVLMFFVFFTMLFSGGIVPSYIMWSNTFKIKDTLLAQLVPNLLLSGWNVMMVRTYFSNSIPYAIYEAAEIDGANHLQVFTKIVLPMGKPILITIGTFAGLGYWNDWTNGLYYISRHKEFYNIQNLLNQMVSNIQYLATSTTNSGMASAMGSLPATGIQMAIAFVAILPIMLIFPFFQKYYAKGIAVGAVK
ncbi:MAG: carbohydrate ABC transporter permease [Clostridia bacterium]|nr:carbohydrate ABC transporter permease [Clostridia bacterium]